MNHREAVNATNKILQDLAAPDWLKQALRTAHARARDIVNAANDAELLAEILRARADWCVRPKR
jgi:hypothetical protein